MQFNVLGPLEATESSASVPLAGGKQRALLALLLLNAGRVVPVERIVDDLWGEGVPETAPKMVQIYVSQLRKQLPDGLLRTRAPGYALELGEHGLDLRRFEELHAEGRAALAAGRHEDAASSLREALALWRGPALAEFDEPFARVEAARLEEARLACLEERVEADLALGRHAELVSELDALARRHPRRERLRAHQLLALYRSGRQAEALDGYRAYRTMLDEELGLEPSAAMRELERRMLRQDPELDAAPRTPAARPASRAEAAPELQPPAEPPPGRERELGFLERLLADARKGERRVAFVTGETGIGKSTVVEAFLDEAARVPGTLVARGQCVEHRGAGEPYLPVLEALGRLCRGPGGDELLPLLAQQAPTWLAQMPWLLADDELDAVQRRVFGTNHERMLREMLEALEAVTARATLVLVLEDLHWSDPSTVDLLDALARRREPARLLLVGTYRRGDAGGGRHAADRLAQNLRGRGLCTEIAVGPLGEDAVGSVIAARLGARPPDEIARLLRERTAGNPLFVTSLLDSWLADGLLADDGSAADPARLAEDVPENVRQVIEQTLLQLEPDDHELLSAASVVGREFAVAAAAAAAGRTEDDADARYDALSRAGRSLVPAGEELWPDGTLTVRYRFGHDLHRAVLYDRLSPSRRARLHARVGERLEAGYGERAREIGGQLAEHFVRAGDARRAVSALRLAAEQALERLAPREALEHLVEALRLVERLPDDERPAEEFALRSMLGAAQVAAKGWAAPEAEAAFVRAHELADQLGRVDDSGWALLQLGSLYEVRGEYERAAEMLERALAACGPAAGPGLLTDSHEVLACSLFHQGVFAGALQHAERGLAAYDGVYVNLASAAQGDHSGTGLHTWAALSLWFLGYPDQAWARARNAVELTGENPHRNGQATALAHAAIIAQCRRDPAAAQADAEAAIEIAARGGYRYRLAMATVLRGWARAAQGEHDEGIAELERGIELSQATGGHMDDPYYFSLLVDARARAGRTEDALAAVGTALEHTPRGDRAFFYKAELYRLHGELELASGRRAEGEERLRAALELARSQGARSLELRAAVSLARLLGTDGKGEDARDGNGEDARELVREVYDAFSEGFETPDLLDARALLEGLPAATR